MMHFLNEWRQWANGLEEADDERLRKLADLGDQDAASRLQRSKMRQGAPLIDFHLEVNQEGVKMLLHRLSLAETEEEIKQIAAPVFQEITRIRKEVHDKTFEGLGSPLTKTVRDQLRGRTQGNRFTIASQMSKGHEDASELEEIGEKPLTDAEEHNLTQAMETLMDMDADGVEPSPRIAELEMKLHRGTITPTEARELLQWATQYSSFQYWR
jgi:hypothetical protein